MKTTNKGNTDMNNDQGHTNVKDRLGSIINSYWVSSWVEVCVQEHADGSRSFFVVNTHSDIAERIDAFAARAMCITPDSTITDDNWNDFCTARGIFTEDN